MAKRAHHTTFSDQGIHPAVFKGITLIGMTQGLRILAGFFYSWIEREDSSFELVGFVALLFIILLFINLTAVWATLPASNRGIWLIDRLWSFRLCRRVRGFTNCKPKNAVLVKRCTRRYERKRRAREKELVKQLHLLPPLYPGVSKL